MRYIYHKKAYKSVIYPEIQAYILNVYLFCVAFTWNVAFKLKVKQVNFSSISGYFAPHPDNDKNMVDTIKIEINFFIVNSFKLITY